MLLVYLGVFSVYNYYEIVKEKIDNKTVYTAGFRSWDTEVVISDIKIQYFDKYGQFYEIDSNVIYNSTIWKRKIWINGTDTAKDTTVKAIFNETDNTITIKKCGIAINPNVFNDVKPNDFYIEASFILKEVENDENPFYSSQICLMVPAYQDPIDENKFEFTNQIYLAYEYFYEDFAWSKLRIPGINYDFLDEVLEKRLHNKQDSIIARENIAFICDSILKNVNSERNSERVKLSALYYNNRCVYRIINKDNGVSKALFDFDFSEYKSFVVPDFD